MTRLKFLCSLALLAMASPVLAHHAMDPRGWASIEIKGTIEFISWDGAHAMYRIKPVSERNETTAWEVMGASPKILSTRNIAKSTFKVGEQVTVTGWIDPHNKIVAPQFFIAADGHRYELGFYPPPMRQ